jgi:hypothetical protein
MRAADIGKAMSALLSSSIGREDALLHLGVKSAVYFFNPDKKTDIMPKSLLPGPDCYAPKNSAMSATGRNISKSIKLFTRSRPSPLANFGQAGPARQAANDRYRAFRLL